jgi:cell division protein FtsI (penicillin-binding protein 3)
MAIAPSDKPRYLFLTILDEPQGLPETHGFATSGWNAAPVTGALVERVAPMLGIPPHFDPPAQPFPAMVRLGAWGTR